MDLPDRDICPLSALTWRLDWTHHQALSSCYGVSISTTADVFSLQQNYHLKKKNMKQTFWLCILWNLTEILDKAERQEPQLILLAPLDACSALNVHICGIRMNRKAFCLLPKEVFPVQWTTKQLFSLLIWVEADFIVKKKKKKAKIGCMYKRSSQPALISAPQIPPIWLFWLYLIHIKKSIFIKECFVLNLEAEHTKDKSTYKSNKHTCMLKHDLIPRWCLIVSNICSCHWHN